MPYWQVHFLNARHALTGIMPEVRSAVAESVSLAAGHLDLPDMDVVVRAGDGGPDGGALAAAPAPGMIELTLSPARFARDLTIRRMLRALHHVARWDGPGYGRSLGEVLASEGLAGHFTVGVLGGPPDPRDATAPPSGLARRAMTEWAWRDLDRGLWFEGRGNIRKWAGYGLAHRLLAEHLAREGDSDPAVLVHLAAEALRPAMRRLSGTDAPDPDAAPDTGALRGGEGDRPPQATGDAAADGADADGTDADGADADGADAGADRDGDDPRTRS